MGLAVYVEDQIHRREYAGGEIGQSLTRAFAAAQTGSLLSGIAPYGDTMFNVVQLQTISSELAEISDANPDLAPDVAMLRSLIIVTEKKRGYIWVSGD